MRGFQNYFYTVYLYRLICRVMLQQRKVTLLRSMGWRLVTWKVCIPRYEAYTLDALPVRKRHVLGAMRQVRSPLGQLWWMHSTYWCLEKKSTFERKIGIKLSVNMIYFTKYTSRTCTCCGLYVRIFKSFKICFQFGSNRIE